MIKINIHKPLYGSNGDMALDVDISLKEGEFIALSGESGAGKTTLLRVLAGLESSSGSIKVLGKCWQDEKVFLKPQYRNIGFVFQDYALFDNMSVEQNLLYVKKDKSLCEHLLEVTELIELRHRHPSSLSGGQKQRISLCRALMAKPKLLLLDEPLSALDPNLRIKLQDEILKLHKEFKTTTLMVSHDVSEIYKLSDRVLKLKNGKIASFGSPKEVLLKTQGSQKFSFEGEILDTIKTDAIFVAIVSIGQQIVEVVISPQEAKTLKIGQKVRVSTKAFSPNINI